jgi:hypothetical protein
MLPVKRTSGFGMTPPGGLQKVEDELAGQATMRAKPSELGPTVAVDEVGTGFAHDGKPSGAPCSLSAAVVSHGSNAGTSETLSGEAPTG